MATFHMSATARAPDGRMTVQHGTSSNMYGIQASRAQQWLSDSVVSKVTAPCCMAAVATLMASSKVCCSSSCEEEDGERRMKPLLLDSGGSSL